MNGISSTSGGATTTGHLERKCTFYIVGVVKMYRLVVDMKTDKRGDVYTKSVCNCKEEN